MRADPLLQSALQHYTLSFVVHAGAKRGKALAVSTPILTVDGWKTMGTLEIGDLLFHPSGGSTKVVATTDEMVNRPCYMVTTKSGRTITADADHQWLVHRAGERPLIRTTQQIHTEYVTGKRRWVLPTGSAIDTPERILPIDPYVLGVWLGDGNTAGAVLTLNENDSSEILQRITDAGVQWRIREKSTAAARGCVSVGLLGCKPLLPLGDKHIPEEYMCGSVAQRRALLQGLIDTDGHTSTHSNGSGVVEYTSKLPVLIQGAWELVWSLGLKPGNITSRMVTLNGKLCGPYYRFTIPACKSDGVAWLSRKIASLPEDRKTRGRSDAVVSVVPVPSVPVRCVEVSADDGLFYAGRDFMITHNSTLAGTAPKPLLVIDVDGDGTRFLPYRKVYWDPRQGPPPRWDGSWDMCVCIIENWSAVEVVNTYLLTGQHMFASIVVDSLTELQIRCKKNIKGGSSAFRIQDYGDLLERMNDVITQWRDLTRHPTNPVSVVGFVTETMQRDGLWRPYLEGRMATRLPYKSDLYGYLYVADIPDATNPLQTVSVRRMQLVPSQFVDAGERVQMRLGAVVDVPAGVENITRWLFQVYTNNQGVQQ